MSESDDKSEKPTRKKLTDARKEGNVSQSADLVQAISMAAVVLLVAAGADTFKDVCRSLVTLAVEFVNADHSSANIHAQVVKITRAAIVGVVPYAVAAALAALLASMMQIGVKIAMKPVTPNMMAVHPITGFRRIFSMKSLIDMAKMLVKASLVAAVMYYMIRSLLPLITGSLYQPLPGLSLMMWQVLLRLLIAAVVIFLLMSVADIRLQAALFIKRLKMSKSEVKRELKQMEGDPRIKGERRRLAREMVEAPPPARLSLASVLLVNPTHYAVALRYAPDEHPLPRVIVKGMDEHAAVLRGEARDVGVPIIGNPPLARALYKIGIEQPIPEELFETVAAILRWVNAIGARNNDASNLPSRPNDSTELPC